MNKIKIYLNNFDRIRDFVKVADTLNCRLKLASGNFIVDGKSILGIFALDLTNAIEVSIFHERQDPNYCPKELETFMFMI